MAKTNSNTFTTVSAENPKIVAGGNGTEASLDVNGEKKVPNTISIPRSSGRLVDPTKVHETLSQHMLVDGFDIVVDLERSQGSVVYDARTGKKFLDFFTFFASLPIGMNHPKMTGDDAFLKKLSRAAMNKPSSSDAYTVEMAEFVQTFGELAMPDYLPHLFLIEGGGLAVENALKTAFDWKVRKNYTKGYTEERGQLIMHFRHAFHGRTGYTMSLTNTDPNKTLYFPKFKDWPRIDAPYLHFPLNEANQERATREEAKAIAQMKAAFMNNPDRIAGIIIEPIQGEGGDHHFSQNFFQTLRDMADEHDALLIFDEVQTGMGLTGKMWAHQHYVKPDVMSFGKKTQVCGIMAGKRVEEVKDNVFVKGSRINSTWGGNLVDMVRCQKYLEIIEEDDLLGNAARMGDYLLSELLKLEQEFPELIESSRGIGLMCAFSLCEAQMRDLLRLKCYNNGLILIGCGDRSIRFRPALNITKEELSEGLQIIRNGLSELADRDY